MTASTAMSALAGHLLLVPGAPPGTPAIVSTRPDLVPRLARGRLAAQLPGLLASVYTLCAHAQRWTAQRAVLAAAGWTAEGAPDRAPDWAPDWITHPPTSGESLRWATLREQMLRISHDWPRLLPGAGGGGGETAVGAWTDALAGCGLWSAAAPLRGPVLRDWLATHWLGLPPGAWLDAYAADPGGWPRRWAAASGTALAGWLDRQAPACCQLATPGPSLRVTADPAGGMAALARGMVEQPGFCARPQAPGWPAGASGLTPDTGPWSRRADPVRWPAITVWDRLIARLVEVLRLAVDGGGQWLSHGALALGPGEGLAWTETARGLLVHRVQLAPTAAGAAPVVANAQVLAPTEWNCHPDGVLAAALRCLAPGDAAGTARLAVAFDPCVAFDVGRPGDLGQDGRQQPEVHHA